MAASHAATSHWNLTPEPTPAQAKSGDYPKGHVTLHGLPIAIENVRNSVRRGVSEVGRAWENRMAAMYGEFEGTVGADGDPVDVFIGHFPESRAVWIINQGWPDGGFDEHKIMLGFQTEQAARDAYLMSFDRTWQGLRSMHPCTVDQLKWWLAQGDTRTPFTPASLPTGQPSMHKTTWTLDAVPVGMPLQKVLYDLRVEDGSSALLLDAVDMAELLADPDVSLLPAALLDALVVEVNRMTVKMDLLQKVMDAAGGEVKTSGYQISDPVKRRGTMQVAVLFALSDGQTVTIWFHNPDTTPDKLMPLDELISWKWMLNKKDITIVVAPERGKDLNIREVARRIMKLAERNSAAFAKANAKLAERVEQEKAVDAEIVQLTGLLQGLQTQIAVARERKSEQAAEAAAAPTIEQIAGIIGSWSGNPKAWTDPAVSKQIAYAVSKGWAHRPSTSQLSWSEAGVAAYRAALDPKAIEPQPEPIARSGTEQEQQAADAALQMAAGVVADLGGTFEAESFAAPGTIGAWSYGKAELGRHTIRLGASGGGVVQVNGRPFDPSNEVITTAEQVKAAILAIAPDLAPAPAPAPVAEVEPVAAPEVAAEPAPEAAALFGSEAFQAALAQSPEAQATVKTMDVAAKAAGLTVDWFHGTAVLDGANAPADDDEEDDEPEEDEGEDFDAEAEFKQTPADDEPEPKLDGDFVGHPFRGNQHVNAGEGSSAAVNASKRAKGAEKRGDAKGTAKAHKAAYHSHKAALVGAKGQARKYHKTMAAFHGRRSGAKMLDDAAEHDGVFIGYIKRGGYVIGRAMVGDDGKAMVYVGGSGTRRVTYVSPVDNEIRAAMWSDDDAPRMIGWLLAAITPAAPAAAPAPKGDISYTTGDMFTTFLPDTAAGEDAWRVLNATEGAENGKVLNEHAASTIEQLRATGYTVVLAAPADDIDTDALAAALAEPEAEPVAAGEAVAAAAEPEVPEFVRRRVADALGQLNEIRAGVDGAIDLDRRMGGNGRYENDAVQNRAQDIHAAQRTLAEFRQHAGEKGIDAEAFITSLGGEPSFALSAAAQEWAAPVVAQAAAEPATATEEAPTVEPVTPEPAAEPAAPAVAAASEAPAVAAPAADDSEDRAYLEALLNGTADLLGADVFERLEPMFAKYDGNPDTPEMEALLTRAAEAYGDAAQEAAKSALATPA
jgi:hypothetical protein